MAYLIPCIRSCLQQTGHLIVTNFDATLGMGGWLDLTQQGLSPCKKYRAFLALFSSWFTVFSGNKKSMLYPLMPDLVRLLTKID